MTIYYDESYICLAAQLIGNGALSNQDNPDQQVTFIDDCTFMDVQTSVDGMPIFKCDAFLRTIA
ncbi:hypothetical protein AAF463_23985 (plasmid) [Pantoea sp. BJ2]|uniref:Uncharacterized protein n=1 Tax=Pantoea sp. BJ2 TaxID=3141322 RepID=A0AAU7U4A5_9GAMM